MYMNSDDMAVHIFKKTPLGIIQGLELFRVMSAIIMYCQYLKPLEVRLISIRGRGPQLIQVCVLVIKV